MVSIRFRLEAVADVEQAKAWYESQRPDLGTDFFRSLEDVVDLIARHPDGFPEFAPGLRRALMNRFPYAVYYQHAEGRATILACLHNRRSSSRWRARG